jgi:itaconyl-CoA hydratase
MMDVEHSWRGDDNYFEDFVPGNKFRHARGKTLTEFDTTFLAQLVMNTAQGHFNEDSMSRSSFGRRITFGGVIAATVIGLCMQDTGEQAIAEVGIKSARFSSPVFLGDTLYASSEVLEVEAEPSASSGKVTFVHCGFNQENRLVFKCTRSVLLRRRDRSSNV